jgi:hypothetical protein
MLTPQGSIGVGAGQSRRFSHREAAVRLHCSYLKLDRKLFPTGPTGLDVIGVLILGVKLEHSQWIPASCRRAEFSAEFCQAICCHASFCTNPLFRASRPLGSEFADIGLFVP